MVQKVKTPQLKETGNENIVLSFIAIFLMNLADISQAKFKLSDSRLARLAELQPISLLGCVASFPAGVRSGLFLMTEWTDC